MRLRWTPAAAADLEAVSNYLRDKHPQYWQPTILKLYQTIRSLKQWAHLGRVGREPDTRELLFSPLPYIAIYRLKQETVEVLRIYHTSQNRS